MATGSKPQRLPSGSWRVRWLDVDGNRQSATFSSHNDAKAALAKAQAEAEAIREGSKPKPPPVKTFAELADHWMATRALHKRSIKDDESVLKVHLKPAFAAVELRSITYERIEAYKATKIKCAPQTLRHQLNLLGAMLKHAHRLGWLLQVPHIDRPSVRNCGKDFSYFRTTEEVQRFLRAAREDGDDAFTLYATAIYTGMRQGELAAMTWDRVDLERRLITVDRSFDGPTKTDDVRYVPILDPLLPILRAWRLRQPGALVFTNQVGKMLQPKDRLLAERFHGVLDAAGFPRPSAGRRLHYVCFHDMRHTFASHWMMAGGDLFKLQKILGHKTTELTLRYAHLSPAAFAADFGRFNNLAVGGDAEVLPMIRERRVKGRAA
jgi:integrase